MRGAEQTMLGLSMRMRTSQIAGDIADVEL
jgi:hypothetical protein